MSDYLFASPSLVSGMARATDLWGQFDAYNESPTPELADGRATYSDWLAVGRDLFNALEMYPSRSGQEK